VGAETCCDKKVLYVGRFPHDEASAGGEGLGSIEKGDDLGPAKGRHPFHGQDGERIELFIIGFQQLLGEIP
jgi:hypothetical protein